MPDVLSYGDHRHRTWRRSRAADLLAGAVVALLASGLLVVDRHTERSSPELRPLAHTATYGSRANLDLPPGENLSAVARGAAGRADAAPSGPALRAARDRVVASLCGGAQVTTVLSEATTSDFARGDYNVSTRYLGIPMKERPATGSLALQLRFRRDGYEFAAYRRSGICQP